jgi:autotransporter-associated beta strand protein
VDAGATLDLRSNGTIAGLNDITGAGGTVINNGTAATWTLTLGGSGSYYFNGSIADGASAGRITALTKSGPGFQVLSGAGSYSGGTTINGGTLELNAATALGSGGVTLSGTAQQLLLAASASYANAITINGGSGLSGQGLIDTDRGGYATLSAPTLTITAAPSAGGHFGSHSNGSLTVQGYINSAVTVDWRRNNGVFSGGGNYTNFRIRSGTVKLGGHNGLASTATLNLGADTVGGTFDLAGYNQTLVGITKAANAATITNNGFTISTLTTTGNSSFAGFLTDGSSPLALNIGGGTLTLSGNNSYTGGTTIGTSGQ